MEEIIRDIITYADNDPRQQPCLKDDILEFAKRLIDELADTSNAPSNWRNVGEKIADEWNRADWQWEDTDYIYEGLELYNHGADECFGVALVSEDEED